MTVNRNSWLHILLLFIVQKYLPTIDSVYKDWLKQIYADTKKLIDTAGVKQIKLPNYDEIYVSANFERYKTKAKLRK